MMGVYVELKVTGQYIPEKEWAAVFDETVTLLKARKAMGLRRETVTYQGLPEIERTVYSKDIEYEVHDPARHHWQVLGDAETFLTADTFTMYRSRQVFGAYAPPEGNPDIIRDLIQEVEDDREICHSVFGAKTQGALYHFLMLAVGMLVEDRFPEYAVVSGNIDRYQAIRAQEMIREVLGREVVLPIVTDWPRLIQRIQKYRSGVAALNVFDQIVRDDARRDGKERCQAIAANVPQQIFQQWVLQELEKCASPSENDALNLFIDWLNAGFDVKTLLELACVHDAGPQFDPVEVVQELISTLWLTVELDIRKPFTVFQKPKGDVDQVAFQFGNAMFDIIGNKGRTLEVFLPRDELLKHIRQLFPEQMEQVRHLAIKAHKDATHKLETIGEAVQSTRKEIEEFDKKEALADSRILFSLAETDEMSKPCVMMLAGIAFSIHVYEKHIRTNKRLKEVFVNDPDINKCRLAITHILNERDFHLTDQAWRWIDLETDFKLLKSLGILSMIKDPKQAFRNAMRSVFEQRWLCQLTTRWANDADKMDFIKEMLQKVGEED